MVVTRTLIRTLSENGGSPAMMMKDINNTLSADNPRSMFVTLIIGILDIRTGEVTYATAAIIPPSWSPARRAHIIFRGKKNRWSVPCRHVLIRTALLHSTRKKAFFCIPTGSTRPMDPEGRQYSSERLLTKVEGHGSEKTGKGGAENFRQHPGPFKNRSAIR